MLRLLLYLIFCYYTDLRFQFHCPGNRSDKAENLEYDTENNVMEEMKQIPLIKWPENLKAYTISKEEEDEYCSDDDDSRLPQVSFYLFISFVYFIFLLSFLILFFLIYSFLLFILMLTEALTCFL